MDLKQSKVTIWELIESIVPYRKSVRKWDVLVKFYTGLPNFNVIKVIFDFIPPPPISTSTKPTQFQEFKVTLMKLRLNSQIKDLAFWFKVSTMTISQIMLKWLTIMVARLSCLIIWSERETLWNTMPQRFLSSFRHPIAVALNCFDMLIDHPSSSLPIASTWYTVKFLLGRVECYYIGNVGRLVGV